HPLDTKLLTAALLDRDNCMFARLYVDNISKAAGSQGPDTRLGHCEILPPLSKGEMRHLLRVSWLLSFLALAAFAQSGVPIVSGGAAFVSTTDGGQTFFQPIIAPVVVIPLGSKLAVESRLDLREFIARTNGTGDYDAQGFVSVEYLQLNYHVAPRMTISAGRFLTPFNTYTERISPVWIRNFQDAPLIFGVGTRSTGSSNGAMLRGAAVSTQHLEWNYTAYFSASSNTDKFGAGRAAGGRTGILLNEPRLEIGASYQRFLQDTHYNAVGGYLWWEPRDAPVEFRSEYAHSPSGHGYWMEGAFRFVNAPVNSSALARLEPIIRIEQFWRLKPQAGDALPANDAKKAQLGLNYYLPKQVRLNASYGRQLNTGGVDRNVWNVAVTYRFLFPMFPGRSK
ncbi:MAG TPA: hypothetical protein VF135_00175, partial [Terriglobales bacterium]